MKKGIFLLSSSLLLGIYNNVGYAKGKSKTPNFIFIYADDLGYGDLSCYGHPTIKTPNLDRMAHEGIKFSQFYVAAPVCTPSRAALLTGCYPKRVGLAKGVLHPNDKTGLSCKEETIADVLQKVGYKTGIVGKWHLGHYKEFLPLNNGFDFFYGLPFSNDMSVREQRIMHPKWKYGYQLPVMSQNDTIELDPDQTQLTRRLTRKALDFIETNRKQRFFLYLAHPMPHVPVYASKDFAGKSKRGKYGDAVEEIDWSVGEILKKLKKLKLDNNTIVMFSSDNGPWLPYGTQGGSAGPLRGGKGSVWEGGMREPFIVWGPNIVPSGCICDEVITNMDVLPTLAAWAKAPLPAKKIDGRNLKDLMEDPDQTIYEYPFYYFSKKGVIDAVRLGPWKLIKNKKDWELYQIEEDIHERYNVAEDNLEKVAYMKDLIHSFSQQINKESRPVGHLEN